MSSEPDIPVVKHISGYSKYSHYLVKEDRSRPLGTKFSLPKKNGNKVTDLGELINIHQLPILPLKQWQISDKIHRPLPEFASSNFKWL